MHSTVRQLMPDEFPELLQEIPDAPARLYVRGILPAAGYHYLCVVGSRAASPYGKRMCHSLIAGLAGTKTAIVSGLAIGLDAEAHKAALAAGLPTVAILPAGVADETIYPRLNAGLAQDILAHGGALVSEHADGPIARWSFPARDRIMAGVSHATLVIEAREKSGTLITARLALEYGRDVLAVPHELGKTTGAGGNRLIREGAALVRHSDDILEALGITRGYEKEDGRRLPADLLPDELSVFSALTEPLEKDSLIARTKLPARNVNAALMSLVLRGLVVERLGKVERI